MEKISVKFCNLKFKVGNRVYWGFAMIDNGKKKYLFFINESNKGYSLTDCVYVLEYGSLDENGYPCQIKEVEKNEELSVLRDNWEAIKRAYGLAIKERHNKYDN